MTRILILLLLLPSLAYAIDDTFPERAAVGEITLTLRNTAELRWAGLFSVYRAALYVEEGRPLSAAAESAATRLEIVYYRDIPGEKFGPAAEKILARQISDEQLEEFRETLERLHRAYRDVTAGDRYDLTYLPGEGLELAFNGQPLAKARGDAFARAYLGIWLGEKEPLSTRVRDRLLRDR